MGNSFGWAEPRPEQNIIFWFHREQKRGILRFTEQHWHLWTFCFWGPGSLKKVAVWRCLPGSFFLCAMLWPLLSLECHCWSVWAATVLTVPREEAAAEPREQSQPGRLLSVRAKFAVTKTEELLQVQSLQLLQSLPMVYDRQLLLSSCQEMCYK